MNNGTISEQQILAILRQIATKPHPKGKHKLRSVELERTGGAVPSRILAQLTDLINKHDKDECISRNQTGGYYTRFQCREKETGRMVEIKSDAVVSNYKFGWEIFQWIDHGTCTPGFIDYRQELEKGTVTIKKVCGYQRCVNPRHFALSIKGEGYGNEVVIHDNAPQLRNDGGNTSSSKSSEDSNRDHDNSSDREVVPAPRRSKRIEKKRKMKELLKKDKL